MRRKSCRSSAAAGGESSAPRPSASLSNLKLRLNERSRRVFVQFDTDTVRGDDQHADRLACGRVQLFPAVSVRESEAFYEIAGEIQVDVERHRMNSSGSSNID